MELRKRIIEYINSLGVTQAEFERNCGLSNGSVNKMRINTRQSTIDKISARYPDLNTVWLKTGEGDMLNSLNNSNAEIYTPQAYMEVSVVPFTARAGSLGEYEQLFADEGNERMLVPTEKVGRGKYLIFTVQGDSMLDRLAHGDRVLARNVQRHPWQESRLHFRQWSTWIIITRNEGILIKEIIDHNVEKGTITLHSVNQVYSDFTIEVDDILEIYNAVELVQRKL